MARWFTPMPCRRFGKMPVNFGLLGVDMMTLSAHKLGGPLGMRRAGGPRRPAAVSRWFMAADRNCAAGPAQKISSALAGFAAVAQENRSEYQSLARQAGSRRLKVP